MSSKHWTFSELKFPKPDLRSFEEMYKDAIERIEHAKDGGDVLEIIIENNELSSKAKDLLEVALIKQSMDTTNEKYEEEAQWVYKNRPFFNKATVAFNEAVYNSPFRDYIEEKLGPMYFKKMDLDNKTFCEENITLQQRASELGGEYQRLIATCRVEIDGEEKSFMSLQKLFSHEDREVRKKAFRAFSEFLAANEERLEEIWSELIDVRNQMGRNLGHDNYLPVAYLRRGRIDYGPKEVEAFRKQVVEEIVPFCTKLYEAQAKRLGLDRVMAYDENIIFPDGNANPIGDAKYTRGRIVDMFHEMSPETEEFIDFMCDHELMDCGDRPGKAAREYSTILYSKKAPFIFSFFDGSAQGSRNLIGSMGHSFAVYRSSRKQHLDLFYTSSADIMEIHVMSMMQFANRYAENLFGADADKFRFYNLQDLMTFIPFGTAVDEFQHICYSKPELTPKERSLEWSKLEKKYMPWRTYDEDDEFMKRGGYWYHKQHIYLYPLYYIEYALSTVNAMEMNRRYVEHPTIAWSEYLDLTDSGGSKGYLDTLKTANLTPAFEEGAVAKSISYAKNSLEEYIKNH